MTPAEAARRWAERTSFAQAAFAWGVQAGETAEMVRAWREWLDTLPTLAPPAEPEAGHR